MTTRSSPARSHRSATSWMSLGDAFEMARMTVSASRSLGHVDQVGAGAEHPVVAHPQEALAGVVVDEPDDRVRRVLGGVDQPGHLVAGVPGPVHQRGDGMRAMVAGAAGQQDAHEPASRGHEHKSQGRHEQPHTTGERRDEHHHQRTEGQRGEQHGDGQAGGVTETADAASSQVELGGQAHEQLQDDGGQRVDQHPRPAFARELEVVADDHEHEQRQHPGESVQGHQHHAANRDGQGHDLVERLAIDRAHPRINL